VSALWTSRGGPNLIEGLSVGAFVQIFRKNSEELRVAKGRAMWNLQQIHAPDRIGLE
jgi:hypothetical protein